MSFGRHAPMFKRPKYDFQEPKKKEVKFQYGNYHQYYGYRNQGTKDARLTVMRREWFKDKYVLDIGCNAGHLTLDIARDFNPKLIIGIDIDGGLVKMAMKNVRHYVEPELLCEDDFPMSFPLSYGPVAQAADPKYPVGKFPYNVHFAECNYILPNDSLLQKQEAFFDTVLCLSLTKWVHLNWGDEGVKMLFRRIYSHLRPGGYLILESQPYKTYAKRKKMTEETLKNYNEIKFLPENFNEYLLNEVGFTTCELIDIPAHSSKGFSRPIYLFQKKEDPTEQTSQPRHILYSDNTDGCNDSDVEEFE